MNNKKKYTLYSIKFRRTNKFENIRHKKVNFFLINSPSIILLYTIFPLIFYTFASV